MNEVATGTAEDCDVIVLVVDVSAAANAEIRPEDTKVLAQLAKDRERDAHPPRHQQDRPCDGEGEAHRRARRLRRHARLCRRRPLSAKKRDGVDRLLTTIAKLLPSRTSCSPRTSSATSRSASSWRRWFASRCSCARARRYRTAWRSRSTRTKSRTKRKTSKAVTRIKLTVHVAKDSHRASSSAGGKMLVAMGTAARQRAERLIGGQVHLDIKVKATPNWFDDDACPLDPGYGEAKAKSNGMTQTSTLRASRAWHLPVRTASPRRGRRTTERREVDPSIDSHGGSSRSSTTSLASRAIVTTSTRPLSDATTSSTRADTTPTTTIR